MKRKHIGLILAGLGLLTTAQADIVLATGGKPQATIVVPAKTTGRLKWAALDLQHYVEKICGVKLPIKEDGKAVEGQGLYLGDCELTTSDMKPTDKMGWETYSIRETDRGVFFTGKQPTCAMFAVYSFLEDDLGIRWYAPGELWERVPKAAKTGELTVKVKSRMVEPHLSPRVWSGHNWTDDWSAWNNRNKTVQSEIVSKRQFQNRIYQIFPVEKYGQTHPEYYPLIGGKRYVPPKGNVYWRPCEGNPEVQKIVVDYICDFFEKNPNIDSFSVGMDDVNRLCQCPLCTAMDVTPEDYANRAFSNRHYTFVNIIAKEVAKRCPGKYVGTLIYDIALQLPPKVEKLEPNVFGYITETSASWWMKGQREIDHNLTDEWRKRISHLMRYDYYGFASLAPRYYPHYVDEQMKYDHAKGFEGMYIEVYTFLPLTMPMIWQTAKLQWDTSLNTDALLDDFMNIYGEAKPAMAKFWQLMEKTYTTPRGGRGKWEHRNIMNMALSSSPEDLEALGALLNQADAMTQDADVHARIQCHRDALKLTAYAVLPYAISTRAATLNVDNQENADAVFAAVDAIAKSTEGREEFLQYLAKQKTLQGANFRALTEKDPYMPIGFFNSLTSNITMGFINAIDWYHKNKPAELAAKLAPLSNVNSPESKFIRSYVKTFASGEEPKNLIVNGDFSQKAEKNDGDKPFDWTVTGAPAGWNAWSNSPGMITSVVPDGGLDGPAACISNCIGGGCMISRVPVKPGDIMLIKLNVRMEGAGKARLSVRFHNAKGNWAERKSDCELVFPILSGEKWKQMSLMVTVPDDGATMVVMPGAAYQHSEKDHVYYDSVEAYRLKP